MHSILTRFFTSTWVHGRVSEICRKSGLGPENLRKSLKKPGKSLEILENPYEIPENLENPRKLEKSRKIFEKSCKITENLVVNPENPIKSWKNRENLFIIVEKSWKIPENL